jgi:hypothetical protein
VFFLCALIALANTRSPMKIVLAYSGGLDTSVIVKWLKETYDAEIITFSADIGQEEELTGLPQKARRTGATRHYTLDLVEEFARDFIYPMIRANAVYEGQYHLGTSIARPLRWRTAPPAKATTSAGSSLPTWRWRPSWPSSRRGRSIHSGRNFPGAPR